MTSGCSVLVSDSQMALLALGMETGPQNPMTSLADHAFASNWPDSHPPSRQFKK